MTSKLGEKNRERWIRGGFKNLLLWLFVYLVIGPFLEQAPFAASILSGFLTIALISAMAALGESRIIVVIASSLLAAAVSLLWLQTLGVITSGLNGAALALACFFALLVYAFGRLLLQIRKVTGNVICAALCLYLMLGMLWGALFAVLESLVPGSFSGALLEGADSHNEFFHHLQYFSFVTLSTLGYGDITPMTRGAAALCQTEAILGQFLTVVIVARLVGIQVAQESSQSPS